MAKVKMFCPEMTNLLSRYGFHTHAYLMIDEDYLFPCVGFKGTMPPGIEMILEHGLPDEVNTVKDSQIVQVGSSIIRYIFSSPQKITIQIDKDHLLELKGLRFSGPWLN